MRAIYLLSALCYVTGLAGTARAVYARVRPSLVPVCGLEKAHVSRDGYSRARTDGNYEGHFKSCYRRWAQIEEVHEGVLTALGFAVIWPLFLTAWMLAEAVMLKAPETQCEKRERLRKLKDENDKLERELLQ